ncbi:ABC transporter substrate-binding protein [Bordetella genomosp. 13]|uniref:Leucine-binding protein domain-containing protein n=1 Tax=Bordetella genomosp. 13 TaxID=463040 RepID=A0A1W6ZC43_9BORD|nr:ABC transporter substrate-binding protein [Bordetella genomosp. 13]ARP94867.1 hypothetical protein CAL15_11015 [Bordetella genomosp. 13]
MPIRPILFLLRRAACAAAAFVLAGAAHGQKPPPPLRVGDVNSYKAYPAFLDPYRKGWQLALEQVNAEGGVLGRKLQVVTRDDGDRAEGAVQAAQQLREQDGIDIIFGGFRSEPGLALADFAAHNQVFYLAAAPLSDRLVWQEGNRYTYRVGISSRMLVAAVAPRALGLRKQRWAVVYSDDEDGRGMAATFRSMLEAFQSNAEFVSDLPVPAGKFDWHAALQQVRQARPDAIFSALRGVELSRFAQAGNAMDLFDERAVVAPLAGMPEYLEPLGADAPAGWIVAGYPWHAIDLPGHRAFAAAYTQRYGIPPRAGSLLGYTTLMSLAAGLRKADSATPDALTEAFSGLEVDTPLGRIRFRKQDHQSTLGTHIGVTIVQDGVPAMQMAGYQDGARLQLPDNAVRRLRAPEPRPPRPEDGETAAPDTQTGAPAAPAADAVRGPADRGQTDARPPAQQPRAPVPADAILQPPARPLAF